MLKIRVSGREYDLCAGWEDLTLERFMQLISIEMPGKFREKWQALLRSDQEAYNRVFKEIDYKDIIKHFPVYFGKVIRLCSTIPDEVIDQVPWEIREQVFNEYLLKFVVTSLADLPLDKDQSGLCPYAPKQIKKFEFKGETYYLPSSLECGGVVTPMAGETILTFSESSDIEIALHEWSEKGIEAMAQITAVYCRKKGGRYDEQKVIERTDKFRQLPMSVVWEVFFCIIALGLQSQIAIKIFSGAMEEAKQEMQPANPVC